jgi:4-hydroxy-3-methylbut-2-enyl diphosphate reductase
MQGDRIVGKETLPILIGQKRAFKLLQFCLVLGMALLVLAGLTGVMTPLSFLLVIPSLLLWGVIYAHSQGHMLPGMPMEFKVESLLILCGVIALFCSRIFKM